MSSNDIIFSIIMSMAPALIIVPLALYFGAAQNKKTFKDLIDKYSSTGEMPPEAFWAYSFQYGLSRFRNKAIKMLERGKTLLIKLPMINLIEIPFSEFKSVTTQEMLFSMIFIEITLKSDKKILFRLNKNQLTQIPELLKISAKKEMSAQQKANLQMIKDPALKSKVTNFLRACVLFVVIIVALLILNAKYGLGM